MLPGAESCAS
jgi:hypothetical protein